MEYFDLDTEISVFSRQASSENAKKTTVLEAIDDISNGKYKEPVIKYRETGDDEIKRSKLPSVAFHGVFDGSRSKENLTELNGILIVDIDDIEESKLEDAKEMIIDENNSVLAAFISPSGTGIKCLYLVDNLLITVDNYRKIGKKVAEKFDKFGKVDVLSVTDCVIMSYDPLLILNDEATFDTYIKVEEYVKKDNVELEKRDKSKELFDDPLDFFNKVIGEQIEERASNNYDFIQMSVAELAKFGFKSPEYDIDFVADISEGIFGHGKENSKKLADAIVAFSDVEQTKWPYDYTATKKAENLSRGYEDEEEYDIEEEDTDKLSVKERKALEKFVKSPEEVKKEFVDVINQGKRAGLESHHKYFSNNFRPTPKTVTLTTGISGHGKSEFMLENILSYCIQNDVKAVMFGSEESIGIAVKKLVQKILGFLLDKGDEDREEVKEAYKVVYYYFKFIDHSKTDEIGDLLTVASAIRKTDDKFFFFYIDPYNQISTSDIKDSDPNQVDKKVMSKLTRFVNRTGYHQIIVAHPKKSEGNKDSMPTANSPSGSGDLRNKTHNMLVVHWHKKADEKEWKGGDNVVEVRTLKIKQANWGSTHSSAYFKYNSSTTRYMECDKDGNFINVSPSSNKSWLSKIVIGNKNLI